MNHILGCPQGNRDVNTLNKRVLHPRPPGLKGTLSYTGKVGNKWVDKESVSHQEVVCLSLLLIFSPKEGCNFAFFQVEKSMLNLSRSSVLTQKNRRKSLFIVRNQHKSNFQEVLIHLVNTNPDELMHSISLSTIKV